MIDITIIVLAAVMIMILLYYEKENNSQGILSTKTLTSLLFIVAVIVQPHNIKSYYYCILVGLVLGLIGDVFLALPYRGMFQCGLVAFLLGHIAYSAAFCSQAVMNAWLLAGLVFVLSAGTLVFNRLKPHVGTMKIPILAYIIIISVMLVGVWMMLFNSGLAIRGRSMAFTGASCFYISDIFVARDRFIAKQYMNRLVGLPLYYAGQFLLAFSVGFI